MVNKPINEQKPLDVAIAAFLSQVPALSSISVVNQTGDTLPTLGQFYPGHADPLNGQKNPSSKESYWLIIETLAQRAGLICFMQLENLVITTPKNQATTVGDDIKFIYGKNVKKIEFEAKLGRLKNINIQVRSRVGKTVIIAKIPLEANQSWCNAFGIKKAEVIVPVLLPTGQIDTSSTSNTVKTGNSVQPTKTTTVKAVAGQPAPYLAFPVPNVSSHAQLVIIGQLFMSNIPCSNWKALSPREK